ncbi:MAG: NUDIX hydrolase [Thermosynechococcaceae cyanobacterium]
MDSVDWRVQDRFLDLRSQWLTLIGEHLQDTQGEIREYWRIEKADSVVILPLLNHQIILPSPSYRPGLGIATLDFPGGRVPAYQSPQTVVPAILNRELGIEAAAIANLTALNQQGWPVNSSFSNQTLYGLIAELQPDTPIAPDFLGATYETTKEGVESLLKDLLCLQCRTVLLEWHRSFEY